MSGPLLGVVGDVHASLARLDLVIERLAAEPLDGVLLAGDIGAGLGLRNRYDHRRGRSWRSSVDQVFERISRLGVPVLYVPGNHDRPDMDWPGNADGVAADMAGLRVGGIGGAGPHRFGFWYEWDEQDAFRRASRLGACDILLCHCPPARTALDLVVGRGEHAGSEAIRELAESHRGVLVCGHIHEAPGVFHLGECLCLNAGSLGHPFAREQVGFLRGVDEVAYEDLVSGETRVLSRGSGSRTA